MADPELPNRGALTTNLLFWPILPKHCMKMKNMNPEGTRVSGTPLDPPMITRLPFINHKWYWHSRCGSRSRVLSLDLARYQLQSRYIIIHLSNDRFVWCSLAYVVSREMITSKLYKLIRNDNKPCVAKGLNTEECLWQLAVWQPIPDQCPGHLLSKPPSYYQLCSGYHCTKNGHHF